MLKLKEKTKEKLSLALIYIGIIIGLLFLAFLIGIQIYAWVVPLDKIPEWILKLIIFKGR